MTSNRDARDRSGAVAGCGQEMGSNPAALLMLLLLMSIRCGAMSSQMLPKNASEMMQPQKALGMLVALRLAGLVIRTLQAVVSGGDDESPSDDEGDAATEEESEVDLHELEEYGEEDRCAFRDTAHFQRVMFTSARETGPLLERHRPSRSSISGTTIEERDFWEKRMPTGVIQAQQGSHVITYVGQ